MTRASRTIPAKAIEDRVAQALSSQYALGPVNEVTVTFDRELTAIHVEPSAKGEPRVGNLNYDARSGRFEASSTCRPARPRAARCGLSGRAAATREVVTLARPLERGEVIKASDSSSSGARAPKSAATLRPLPSRRSGSPCAIRCAPDSRCASPI